MKRSWLLLLAVWALGVVFVYGILGFAVVPIFVKRVIVAQIATQLHREATVAGVSFNPFTLAATVRGLSVRDPAGTAPELAFDQLYLDLSLLPSL